MPYKEIQEIANFLGVHRTTVLRWAEKAKILTPCNTPRFKHKIPVQELMNYLTTQNIFPFTTTEITPKNNKQILSENKQNEV